MDYTNLIQSHSVVYILCAFIILDPAQKIRVAFYCYIVVSSLELVPSNIFLQLPQNWIRGVYIYFLE